MKTVRLDLPEEIVRRAAIRPEEVRSLPSFALSIDGTAGTAGAVSLATLREHAPALVAAIRRWRLYQDTSPRTLTVKGCGPDVTIDLPPNVGTEGLLRQLRPLLGSD